MLRSRNTLKLIDLFSLTLTPKCSIARDWTDHRPCGKEAITRNNRGGLQCEFHSEGTPYPNPNPSCVPLNAKSSFVRLRMRLTYIKYLFRLITCGQVSYSKENGFIVKKMIK